MSLINRDQQLAHRGNFEKDGKLYLVNCYACGRENWALMVNSGKCAWCGWCQDDASLQDDIPCDNIDAQQKME